MQVWELISRLSKCPAGAAVTVGVCATLNAEADEFDFTEDSGVSIRSSLDVECVKHDGDTVWLSELVAEDE